MADWLRSKLQKLNRGIPGNTSPGRMNALIRGVAKQGTTSGVVTHPIASGEVPAKSGVSSHKNDVINKAIRGEK